MINTTNETLNGRAFIKTVSDTYMIRKVGTEETYSEAWDLPDMGFTYAEMDIPLETEEPQDEQI